DANEQRTAPGGERKCEHTTGEAKQETLGQKLSRQAPASRAERGTDGDLSLPRFGARDEQVRNIRASNEQHECDGAENEVEYLARAAENLVRNRNERSNEFGVGIVRV